MGDATALEYGPPQAGEIDELNGLLEQALTFNPGTMAGWTSAIGHERLRAVHRNGRLVAGMSIIQMGHYIGGRIVRAGGITAVGVAPDQRGSGVGLWMIQQSLRELQSQGVPLATLYPATTAFYRRAGFERAATRTIYDIPVSAIGVRDYSLDATPAGPDDRATLQELYAQQGARGTGFVDRPQFYWDQILTPRERRAYAFVVRRDGVPEGYIVFNHASWGETLQVRDLVALTPAAGRRLLTILADHRTMIETVRLPGGPADTIFFLMPEQRQKAHNVIDMMLRFIDVAAALEARGYAPGVSAELHFELEDDLLSQNNGRFTLAVADGRGSVRAGGEGRLRMHVRGLAPLYSGYLSGVELQATGSIEGPDADLSTASAVFAGPRPWLPDMF